MKYRVVTDGEVWRVQYKRWRWPWQWHQMSTHYGGGDVLRWIAEFDTPEGAVTEVIRLRTEDARRKAKREHGWREHVCL